MANKCVTAKACFISFFDRCASAQTPGVPQVGPGHLVNTCIPKSVTLTKTTSGGEELDNGCVTHKTDLKHKRTDVELSLCSTQDPQFLAMVTRSRLVFDDMGNAVSVIDEPVDTSGNICTCEGAGCGYGFTMVEWSENITKDGKQDPEYPYAIRVTFDIERSITASTTISKNQFGDDISLTAQANPEDGTFGDGPILPGATAPLLSGLYLDPAQIVPLTDSIVGRTHTNWIPTKLTPPSCGCSDCGHAVEAPCCVFEFSAQAAAGGGITSITLNGSTYGPGPAVGTDGLALVAWLRSLDPFVLWEDPVVTIGGTQPEFAFRAAIVNCTNADLSGVLWSTTNVEGTGTPVGVTSSSCAESAANRVAARAAAKAGTKAGAKASPIVPPAETAKAEATDSGASTAKAAK